MISGIVRWFNMDIGLGFIAPDAGIDVLVRESEVMRAGMTKLVPGQKIMFEMLRQEGKCSATNLQEPMMQNNAQNGVR